MKLLVLSLLLTTAVLGEDPPKDVQTFFRTAAEALADQDTSAFLAHFNRSMPGFSQLRDDVEALANADVASTIEIAKDEGNEQSRIVELDWLIRIDQARPRREIVRCKIEKQGNHWKMTSFEPLRFFQK